jgi:hypothetical protein
MIFTGTIPANGAPRVTYQQMSSKRPIKCRLLLPEHVDIFVKMFTEAKTHLRTANDGASEVKLLLERLSNPLHPLYKDDWTVPAIKHAVMELSI